MRILLAVDDDAPSYDAALAVSQWFSDETDVVVVHVDAPVSGVVPATAGSPGGLGHYPVMSAAELQARRSEAHKEARETAREIADLTDGEVWSTTDRDPATAVIDLAGEIDADLIVCGTGDRSWFSRLLEPSVSGELVKRAPCSVLVVRDPAV